MSALWIKGGKLKIAGSGAVYECEDCPCEPDAPCDCPCTGTFPPESWPCGGLLEEYAISNGLVSPYDAAAIVARVVDSGEDPPLVTEVRLTGAVVATAADLCLWYGGEDAAEVQERTSPSMTWGTAYTLTGSAEIGLASCAWYCELPGYNLTIKATGLTPIGDYVGGLTDGDEVTTIGITVT
jgi:hypothetical protein